MTSIAVTRQGEAVRRRRRALTRQDVITQALALLEEHGADALSMRRLAGRLGVAPNALYSHVRDKADLLDGLVDEVYAGLDLAVGAAGDWTEQLAELGQAVREHLAAHPAVVALALQQPGLGPHGLRLGERLYDVLRPAGFSDEVVVGAVSALLTYILGFVALEVQRTAADQRSTDDYVRRLGAFYGALPPRQLPNHVELAPLLARFSSDEQFQFGLRTFLAGLAAQRNGTDAAQPATHKRKQRHG
ncbi:MAG: TetR/AcrR family transcriptional regulator [Acidimicrobiales bacterium]